MLVCVFSISKGALVCTLLFFCVSLSSVAGTTIQLYGAPQLSNPIQSHAWLLASLISQKLACSLFSHLLLLLSCSVLHAIRLYTIRLLCGLKKKKNFLQLLHSFNKETTFAHYQSIPFLWFFISLLIILKIQHYFCLLRGKKSDGSCFIKRPSLHCAAFRIIFLIII